MENVISPAGAKGFWQIMRTTGREYGLEVNSNVDERYHYHSPPGWLPNTLKRQKIGLDHGHLPLLHTIEVFQAYKKIRCPKGGKLF